MDIGDSSEFQSRLREEIGGLESGEPILTLSEELGQEIRLVQDGDSSFRVSVPSSEAEHIVARLQSMPDITAAEPELALREVVAAAGAPNPPGAFRGEALPDASVRLTWSDLSADEAGFEVFRSEGDSGVFKRIARPGKNITSMLDAAPLAVRTYQYKIRSYNSIGTSGEVGPILVTTPAVAPPAAPGPLQAASSPADVRIDLTWKDKSADERNFEIHRRAGTGKYSLYKRVAAGTTKYSDTALSAGQSYAYEVRATNAGGSSSFSGESSAVALSIPLPAAPAALTASRGGGTLSVSLAWTDTSTNETGFEIWRSVDGGPDVLRKKVTAGVVQFIDTQNVVMDSRYRYRVRAYNQAGPGAFSPPAEVWIEDRPETAAILPVTGVLKDLVYDPQRHRVYASNYTYGRIEVYDMAQTRLLAPIPVGSLPVGLDMTLDSRWLLVCQSGTSQLGVVDLTATPPTVTQLPVPSPVTVTATNRPDRIISAANGKAFFSCVYEGSGWTDLWELDLATLSIRRRADIEGGKTSYPTFPSRDRLGKKLFFAEGNTSSGEFYTYDAGTDAFTKDKNLNLFHRSSATSPGGTRSALTGVVVDQNSIVRGAIPSERVVFASEDRAYGVVRNKAELSVLDIGRILEIDRWAIPAEITSDIETDDRGLRVFGIAATGLMVIPVKYNRAPIVEPVPLGRVPAGQSVGVTVQAYDPDHDPLTYSALALPPGATFDPATARLQLNSTPAQAGTYLESRIAVSDGQHTVILSMYLAVDAASSYPATIVPIDGQLSDLVVDEVRGLLYVANQTRNRVDIVRLADCVQLPPLPVGCQPTSLDLDRTSRRLLVAPSAAEVLQVFDLDRTPVRLTEHVLSGDGWETPRPRVVAVDAQNRALFATDRYIRQLDLNTGVMRIRSELGSHWYPSPLRASGDRSILVCADQDGDADLVYYSTATDTLNSLVTREPIADVAVNEDGTQVLVKQENYIRVYDRNFALQASIYQTGAYPNTLCFRPGHNSQAFYRNGSYVQPLDLVAKRLEYPIRLPNSTLMTGPLRTDAAGATLFVVAEGGVAIIRLP
ncbi:MAG: hypothetical protein HY699_03305 [Deltaproteobacteria bacterium]|nr:hypothetical protein [Deltaproteobacteria bacterium]